MPHDASIDQLSHFCCRLPREGYPAIHNASYVHCRHQTEIYHMGEGLVSRRIDRKAALDLVFNLFGRGVRGNPGTRGTNVSGNFGWCRNQTWGAGGLYLRSLVGARFAGC